MNGTAIHIEHISKIYKLYTSPSDRLKETFHLFGKKYHHDFFALNDISLTIKQGSTIGIIGQNGAGKSTLLKILTGVLTPTTGTFTVNGKVSSLLELGTGFNPDLTGLENVYFNGAMLGFTKTNIDQKLDAILSFADIGEFINQKVRTYSSGMFVRLAFSVAVQVDPDILIVDEALSVGDIRFQQKCFRRMKTFKESGKTVLFVTHDHGTVINFCDYVYWLKDGRIFEQGQPTQVVKKYISYMSYGLETKNTVEENGLVEPQEPPPANTQLDNQENSRLKDAITWEDVSVCSSFGEGGASITGVALYHTHSHDKVSVLKGGESVIFYMRIRINDSMENLGIGISLHDHLGNTIFAIPSFLYDCTFPPLFAGTELNCSMCFDFPKIKNGKYSISTAVAEGNMSSHVQHHWLHDAYLVEIANIDLKYSLGSIVLENCKFKISTAEPDASD